MTRAVSDIDCDPRFEALLGELQRPPLDHAPDVIYGVWADLTLAYMNARWREFAIANGGAAMLARWPLGAALRSALPDALAPFYERGFAKALRSGKPWEHTYTCPSPTEERWFRLRALPLRGEGLLLWHSPVVLEPAPPGEAAEPEAAYREATGFVTQCCHCRRVRMARDPRIWHFVPAFVERAPPRMTHGLCPVCITYHYNEVLTPDEVRAMLRAESRNRARAHR